jgi:protein-tyrosine phosphatase
MLRASDLVLVMDGDLAAAVEQLDPASRGRVHRLGRFGGFDIPDPVGGGRGDFERALSLIERGVADLQRAFWSRP